MKRITPTLLGTLLLAGSASSAVAAGPVSAPSSPPALSSDNPSVNALQNGSSQNGPATGDQLSQSQQPREQSPPVQNKPNSSEDNWSQDVAAGSGQPDHAAASAGSAPRAGSGQDTMSSKTPAPSGTSKPSAGSSHRQPATASRRMMRPATG